MAAGRRERCGSRERVPTSKEEEEREARDTVTRLDSIGEGVEEQ